jgi:hypothetical protein
MKLFERLRKWLAKVFKKKHVRVGIYGPPNAGKTTLANRITKDWTGEIMGVVTEIPHETRKAKEKKEVRIRAGDRSVTFDIVDTPGIATKIDFHSFMNDYGLSEAESRARAKEATEGVIEAIRWLDDVDGVILVMDSCEDPFTQVNITILGNLQARNLPAVIVANKIDLEEASPATLKSAFPQHPVIPLSALTGYNMESLYRSMVKYFR